MVLGIADSIVGVAGKVLDKFVADKDLKAKLDFELRKAYADANLAQIDVNKEQAKHPSLFVAGARPSIMWICAFGLGWQFVFLPVAAWYMALTGQPIPLPDIETEGWLSLLKLDDVIYYEKWEEKQNTNWKKIQELIKENLYYA